MNYRILLMTSMTFFLAACHPMSTQQAQMLEEKAQQAETLKAEKAKLTAENDLLAAQKINLRELNHSLKNELNKKQVIVEHVKDKPVKITLLNSMLFSDGDYSPGEYELNERGAASISKLVPTIQNHIQQGGIVRIIGHTDNTYVHPNTASYHDNWELSSLRAIMIVRLLIWRYHLPVDAFRVEGHASAEPKDTNSTPAGRANNRRIEIVLASK